MTTRFIHLSDIHYRPGWEENLSKVLNAFFEDLSKQLREFSGDVYVIFSGDLVHAGNDSRQYNLFLDEFSSRLDALGITRDKRICVPGNHDLSKSWIDENKVNHAAVLSEKFSESSFNEYVANSSCILFEKFQNYLEFEKEFCDFGVMNSISGAGWDITEDISVFCLNTAIFASGNSKQDNGSLLVDTRELHKWLNESSTSSIKILVMHHPLSWLSDWAQKEILNTLQNNFTLLLAGHSHEQGLYHSDSMAGSVAFFSAPALFTDKSDLLGYSYIDLDASGIVAINYRQWTKYHSFVSGVNFSNNDTGKVIWGDGGLDPLKESNDVTDIVWVKLKENLELSLKGFSDQPSVWVDPELYSIDEKKSANEADKEKEKQEYKVDIEALISRPEFLVINSSPQFGLTTLAHYFCLKAWESGSFWCRLDLNDTKPHEIEGKLTQECTSAGKKVNNLACIILESWEPTKQKRKSLQKIISLYPSLPVIVMETLNGGFLNVAENLQSLTNQEFSYMFLHSLPRNKIRQIIVQYNRQKPVGDDDDVVLDKVVSDLEALNLHRTALNCLTLLKVLEAQFDDSPVNRTEVIRRILFLLFNVNSLPNYKRRPDMKDCEHVLGWFCEKILRNNNLCFTREHFLKSTNVFCEENLIDIDTYVLFDLLCENNLFVERSGDFCFKFTYWVMFFAAVRMHHDEKFKDYIFEGMRYASYPELIEFYTGLDRKRDDALELMIKDIDVIYLKVSDNLGFPDEVEPYSDARWEPSDAILQKIKEELDQEVENSNLPESIKDDFADRNYNPVRPYNQEIQNLIKDSLLVNLWNVVQAGSRALRNSDFSSAILKKELLGKIIMCWELITKIVLVLTPVLVKNGDASFEGGRFILNSSIRRLPPEERFGCIFRSIPENITNWFSDDLYSQKMGPLFFNKLAHKGSDLASYYLALLLIGKRPHNWKPKVQSYIASLHKNSFYLFGVSEALAKEHMYSFAPVRALDDILFLRKMALAKHKYGTKKPGKKLIDKVVLKNEKSGPQVLS